MDWARAEAWLNELIAAYVSLGWAGSFGLHLTLLPLKQRPVLRVVAECSDLELAEELCGFYARKVARLDRNLSAGK